MVKSRQPGFFTTDAVIGLFIVAALAAALAVTLGRQRKSITALADTREAHHLAQRAMIELQIGRPAPRSNEGSISIERLNDAAPSGQQWVKIVTNVRGRSATLVGLVPQEEATP